MVCPTLEVKSFLERYETLIEECEKNNILLKKENIITVNKYTFEAAYEQVDNYLKIISHQKHYLPYLIYMALLLLKRY